MEVTVFSKYTPVYLFPVDAPETSVFLIFECIPEQYRMVLQWLNQNYPPGTELPPLYRLKLPCTDDGMDGPTDWGDYWTKYDEVPVNDRPVFKGKFECWPSSIVYEFVQIDPYVGIPDLSVKIEFDDINWPTQTRNNLKGFYRDGYYSEYRICLPCIRSGISRVQQYAIDYLNKKEGKQASYISLCHDIAWKFDLALNKVEEQLCRLTQGNIPWCRRNGSTFQCLTPAPPNEYLAIYLVNGPCAFSPHDVIETFKLFCWYTGSVNPETNERITFSALNPSCPPHVLTRKKAGGNPYSRETVYRNRHVPVHHCFFPKPTDKNPLSVPAVCTYEGWYALPSSSSSNNNNEEGEHQPSKVKLANHPPVYSKVEYNLWFVDENDDKVVQFKDIDLYVRCWVDRLAKHMFDKRMRTAAIDEAKYDLIRTIFFTTFIPRTQDKQDNDSIRLFVDESYERKRAYLKKKYGPDKVDELMNIPIGDLSEENAMKTPDYGIINQETNLYAFWSPWAAWKIQLDAIREEYRIESTNSLQTE